jgi:uncharacterized protein
MASSPQHEPTMEEILASIRKIISEDSTEAPPAVEAAPAPVAAPATVAAAPEPEDDIMELTDEVPEAPAPVVAAPAPAPAESEEGLVFQSIEEPAVSSPANSDIFSDKTRKAIDDAFSNIDAKVEPAAKPAPAVAASVAPAADGDSVEAVFERAVRGAVGPHVDQWLDSQKDALLTAMRPLIREWMDEHFPALLEGAVRDEVARVVKARGR